MKVICIGLVIITVLLASSLAMPRKPYARKQYTNYLQEEKDLMQKEMAAAVARNAFGSLNAREYYCTGNTNFVLVNMLCNI